MKPQTDRPKCTHCNNQANGYTVPPLCLNHLDLTMLAEHLVEQGQPVTIESLQTLLIQCQARGGDLSITADEVPGLLKQVSGPMAVRWNVSQPNSSQEATR